jgi:anhydro-N-acetylmuramic acid kinase
MTELYLGLMSGTSMDGVDAVLCEFRGTRFWRTRAAASSNYPGALRSALLRLQREKPAITLDQLARFDRAIAEVFAEAARRVLVAARVKPGAVHALGSHGQTVMHDPLGARSSMQLGDPSAIAALTGITTVADFRRADVARGGQGAPLVPAFHHAVFAAAREPRAIVNIGGIANVTLLPDAHAASVRGFDTGPGNALMDEWAQAHLQRSLDAGGRWAARGRADPALLAALLGDPYFAKRPPKSTGRAEFNLGWVRQHFPALERLDVADAQATFCELTAQTLADAIALEAPATRGVYVCGGGARNTFLMRRLAALMPDRKVATTEALGLAPNLVESAAFAWLALRTMRGLPGNLPAATGARESAVLGGIYRGGVEGASAPTKRRSARR